MMRSILPPIDRRRVLTLTFGALMLATGTASANGRHPQVQLGDVAADMVCTADTGQRVSIANARILDRREVEVQDGIATLIVPLGNIASIDISQAEAGKSYAPALVAFTSGENKSVEIRVRTDEGAALVISGLVAGQATIRVELMLCRRIEITRAGGGLPSGSNPAPAAAN